MRNKILFVLLVLVVGGFMVWGKFKNKLNPKPQDMGTVFNASKGSDKVVRYDVVLESMTKLPTGPVEEKAYCTDMNVHVLCRLFGLKKEGDHGVALEKNRILMKVDISTSYSQAKEVLKNNPKADDATIWTLALGIFVGKYMHMHNVPFSRNWSFFAALENSENGKVKDIAQVSVIPDGLRELMMLYRHEQKQVGNGKPEKFLAGAKEFVKVNIAMHDFQKTKGK